MYPLQYSHVISATGSLQVQAIADVLAILKSSSCTALDLDACKSLFAYRSLLAPNLLTGAACGCTPTLCLRSFIAIPPQHEFRVFFVSGCAVAVSQRHVHQFYPHLFRDLTVWSQRIQYLCTLLSSKLPLPSCVVDIAFTEQSPKVYTSFDTFHFLPLEHYFHTFAQGLVIDLDAYCSDTSTLLFSPEDILASASAATAAQHSGVPFRFEIRVLQNDTGLQPSPAMYHGIPLDLQVPFFNLHNIFFWCSIYTHLLRKQSSDAADLETALQRVQSERSQ